MFEQTEATLQPAAMYIQNNDPILKDLIAEIEAFVLLLKNYDIEVELSSGKAIAAWAQLTESAKADIFKRFSTYHRNCSELHGSGISLRDNNAVLAHCLKRANLFSKQSLRGFVEDKHMVEVYNLDNIQILRSINFFDYCNYSIMDLLARDWMNLYERLSSMTASIFREIHEIVAAKETRTFQTPAHVMREIDAVPNGVFCTDFRFCSTLFSAPDVAAGYLLLCDVTELGVDSVEPKLVFLR
ncbi:MAG: hypothetical protein ACXWQO_11310 [Bdellovibrionota bacterium]